MTTNILTQLQKEIFDYDPDGPNIHHLMAVHGYSRMLAQMEEYCKRESIPEMKKNVFKTESGRYMLRQMFELSKR